MQLTDKPSKIVLPFADAGGKRTIPTASQIGILAGAASFTDGFPPLTRTDIALGGIPPSGLDMNGVLFDTTALSRWHSAGGGFPFDSAFVADVGGYPKGAKVLRTDGAGYWLNTVDNNSTDPESSGTGWVSDFAMGEATVAMSGANVTLTALQAAHPIIRITGTLTTNLQLFFPAIIGEWLVINDATGAFTVTAKTATGTGVTIATGSSAQIYGDTTNINPSSTGLGDGQAFYARTPTIGTTYYNTTGRAIEVIVNAASAANAALYCNINGVASLVVNGSDNITGQRGNLTFTLPHGAYYQLTGTNGTGAITVLELK